MCLFFLLSFSAHAKKKFETFESKESPYPPQHFIEKGKLTIVEFYVDWCPVCKEMPKYYKTWKKNKPKTAIKRIRLPRDFDFENVNSRHKITLCALPHFFVYDENGMLVSGDQCQNKSAFDYVFSRLRDMGVDFKSASK